jgi:peptidoglycan lytic transglycosylase
MSRATVARRTAFPKSSSAARLAAVLAVLALGILLVTGLHRASRDLGLPLADAPIIREQAAAKHLDPALIAGVIYAESKFDPRPSSAGAQGLMQILPETAYYLAQLSGGSRFTASDLATPQVNIAYGAYYLRYLLDHYHGDVMLALAAYNAGITNVDAWVARAGSDGTPLTAERIPFPETREYVKRVLDARAAYAASYQAQLGLG